MIMPLEPYQQRVVLEHQELEARIQKLEVFMDGSIFNSLDSAEQGRLALQLQYMRRYDAILTARIDVWTDTAV